MEVVVDTNMFLAQIRFRVNILEMLRDLGEPILLSSVLRELEDLAQTRWDAKAALKLTKNLKIIKTEKFGDEAILDYAKNNECIVATNDTKLISKLKKYGKRIARLRQRKYIVVE